jgi:hypothetical protein
MNMNNYTNIYIQVKLALHQRFDKKNDYLAALTDVEAKQISHNKKV